MTIHFRATAALYAKTVTFGFSPDPSEWGLGRSIWRTLNQGIIRIGLSDARSWATGRYGSLKDLNDDDIGISLDQTRM